MKRNCIFDTCSFSSTSNKKKPTQLTFKAKVEKNLVMLSFSLFAALGSIQLFSL